MGDPRSVAKIFGEAISLPKAERASFLDEACGGHAEMRDKVEMLIAVHDGETKNRQPSGIESDVTSTHGPWSGRDATRDTAGEGPGGVIGRYRILEVLGEGGFGTVFLAEQEEPVRRRVAVKVIKLGMDTKQVIARFEAERQALAMMDHPNIAKVLDAGATETGRPYFVMELVKGVPITQYCDSTNLSMHDRLLLFKQVCHAVQHAHQKGIIHRDIKPSNVLVSLHDDKPVPKVIDFGIAKATNARLTERTLYTEYRQFIGTPEYMSPEQAEMSGLDVDTRSDIYSLGVLLYELLTGTTPFNPRRLRGVDYGEIQRIIREEDPPVPSGRLSAILTEKSKRAPDEPVSEEGEAPGTVTIEAIAKARRSDPTALRRMLRGDLDWIVMKSIEKDRTRRYDTAASLARDIERHFADEPVVASPPSTTYRVKKLIRRNKGPFAAVSLLIAVLALGAIGTIFGLVRAIRAEAVAEEEAAIAAAVNEFLNHDVLAAVVPSTEVGKGRDVRMREVLDVAAERIEQASRVGGLFADQPLVEASIRLTLVETYRLLGEYAAAEVHAHRAVDLYRRMRGDEHPDTLTALYYLAMVYRTQSRYDVAERLDRQTLETRQRVLGPDHPDTLMSLGNLATVYLGLGRYDEAGPLFKESFEKRAEILGEEHQSTLLAMGALGAFYQDQLQFAEAEALFVRALRIQERVYGAEDPATLGAACGLANLYRSQSRFPEASRLYEKTLGAQRKVQGSAHPNTLWTIMALAGIYIQQRRFAEAEPLLVEAEEGYVATLGPTHRATLAASYALATLYFRLGGLDEAEPRYLRVLEGRRQRMGPGHQKTMDVMSQLVQIYGRQGRTDKARGMLIELIRRQLEAAEAPDATPITMNLCAWLLLTCEPADLRDPETALRLAKKTIELLDHEAPQFLDTLALAYQRNGDLVKATEVQRRAVELLPPGDSLTREEMETRLAEFEAELAASDAE